MLLQIPALSLWTPPGQYSGLRWQPVWGVGRWVLLFLLGLLCQKPAQGRAGTAGLPCLDSSGFREVFHREWSQRGGTSFPVELSPHESEGDRLLRVAEAGVDLEIEVRDRTGAVIARAASPLARVGIQYVFLSATARAETLVVTAREPAKLKGLVRVGLWVRSRSRVADPESECAEVLQKWSQGDAAYEEGRRIEMGREGTVDGRSARGLLESAEQDYEAALRRMPQKLAAERGDLQLLIAALHYYELLDWVVSAQWAQAAAATFTTAGDAYKRARARAILAAAWLEMGTLSESGTHAVATPQAARERWEQARALLRTLARFHARRREEYEESLQINNIGLAYYYEARFEEAIPYFNRARRVFERLAEPVRVAVALQNVALCEWGLGRLSAALPHFDQALQQVGPAPFPNLYLIILNNDALAHYAAGRFDRSLQLHAQAQDFAARSQAYRALARSDYGMGVTYYAVGNRVLATQFLEQALQIDTPDLDARTRVAALRALGQIEHETGHESEAITHHSEALRLATAPSARARILLRLAQDYASQGDPGAATALLDTVIAHPPKGDELVRAMALVQRCSLERVAGRWDAAQSDLDAGLPTLERYDSLAERFDGRVELARLRAAEGRPAEALAEVAEALKLAPEIREQTANPEYRASIAQSLRPALDFELGLLRTRYNELLRIGQPAAAAHVAANALAAVDDVRATGLDNWRAEELEGGSDPRVEHLLAEATRLYRQMADRRFQLATRDDRAGPSDPRAVSLREDIGRLRVRLDVINGKLAELTGRSSRWPGRRHGTAPEWLEGRGRLPIRTVVLSYWVGGQQAYAWVVGGSGPIWVELGSADAVDKAARLLHGDMKSLTTVSKAQRLADCADLYRLIIAPVARYLEGAESLIVVPDGALHYVPFAALRRGVDDEARYLAQQWIISVAPAVRSVLSTSHSAPRAKPPAAARVLIVADPVYTANDPRLAGIRGGKSSGAHPMTIAYRGSGKLGSLTRLDSSAREARQIRALFDPQQVDLLEGLHATRDELVDRDLVSYRLIHFATHGWIDAEIPQLSALILGSWGLRGEVSDPYFRAGDFLGHTLRADAVVLSACDTALGTEIPSEGLIGLRYAALARGARSVVASLWPVTDGIAADLMTGMYREMTASRESGGGGAEVSAAQAVARSLTAAIRQLLQRSSQVDPALWAPFVVYVAGR